CGAAAFENARRSVQQLLLPGVDLVRVNPVRARQLDDGPVAPCLRRGKLLIAASAALALNAAPCFLRVCFMSCSRAIGASYGQGPTLTNCLVFGVQRNVGNDTAQNLLGCHEEISQFSYIRTLVCGSQ